MGSVIDSAVKVGTLGLVETDLSGEKAKGRALDAQKYALGQANSASELAWNRQQQEMEPWKTAGLKALQGLQDGSFYQKDPGYQFRLDEGTNSINAALAARGMANSGAALKELSRYGQNFASNEYQNAWNRQNQLANYGNQASQALGNFAGGYGSNLANNAIGYGNSASAAEIGQANMNNQLFSGLLNAGGKAAGAAAGGA